MPWLTTTLINTSHTLTIWDNNLDCATSPLIEIYKTWNLKFPRFGKQQLYKITETWP